MDDVSVTIARRNLGDDGLSRGVVLIGRVLPVAVACEEFSNVLGHCRA